MGYVSKLAMYTAATHRVQRHLCHYVFCSVLDRPSSRTGFRLSNYCQFVFVQAVQASIDWSHARQSKGPAAASELCPRPRLRDHGRTELPLNATHSFSQQKILKSSNHYVDG